MPKRRLFGNAVLSILAKFASGYWNLVDPTNGYVAFNARLLAAVAVAFVCRLLFLRDFGALRTGTAAAPDSGTRDADDLQRRAEFTLDRKGVVGVSAAARWGRRYAAYSCRISFSTSTLRRSIWPLGCCCCSAAAPGASTSGSSVRSRTCLARPARSCSRCCRSSWGFNSCSTR